MMPHMKKLSILLVILITVTSCSPLKITSDFDRSANFSSYKTYSFIVYPESLPYDRNLSSTAISSIANELESRGFTKSENPDVFIDMKVKIGQKKTDVSYGGDYPDMYGYGYIYIWSTDFSTSSINFNTYANGTMFIDIIDARKKQLVWQGRGTAKVDPDLNSLIREKNVAETVKKIFTKYPPKL
jgi:hypothetical protein